MLEDISEETKNILKKLYNKKRIGGKHTEEKNCLRWIKNLETEKHKLVLREWEACIKEELILRTMKTGELHVSINPRRLKEIHELIRQK
mgnify:CR=1 FL=1